MLDRFRDKNLKDIAGCDEAGRGCLAGPVFAAAVVLGSEFDGDKLNDSKKISAKERNKLRDQIEASALAFGIGFCDHAEIDEFNILKASFIAMHRAIQNLDITPDFLLIDGNRFIPYPGIRHQCVIGGDAKFQSIAAASILAKTHRDDYMEDMHKQYPVYQWNRNKGYPTKSHRSAIWEHGISPIHRTTFKLLPDPVQLKMLFNKKDRL